MLSTPTKKIPAELIASLDLARVVAALIVVVDHIGKSVFPALAPFAKFGQEAVIVFFLLSGFVIFANEAYRKRDVRAYAFRRLRRIYPLLIVSMLLSTVIAAWQGTLADRFQLRELLLNLASLQDSSALKPGVIVDSYLNNAPLWSLSYEVFFYFLFPIVLYLWQKAPLLVNVSVTCVSGGSYLWYSIAPGHFQLLMAYFVIWWAGALTAFAYMEDRFNWRGMAGPLIGCLTLTICALLVLILEGYSGMGVYPFLMFRHFLVALLLLVLLLIVPHQTLGAISLKYRNSLAWISSVSYGIYLLHYPILIQTEFASASILNFSLSCVSVIFLAYIFDRRLNFWLRYHVA